MMNAMPKYVVSTTLRELEWNNSTLIEGGVPTRRRPTRPC